MLADEQAIMSRRKARAAKSAADSSAVVDSYARGASIKAAGEAVGRSESFAWNALLRAGISPRRAGNPRSERPERRTRPDLVAAAVTQYLAGQSAKAITSNGPVAKKTLLDELRRRGIPIRLQAQGDPTSIIDSYLAGHSVSACANLHGCTKRRVSTCLRSANVKLRMRRIGACPENTKRLNRERWEVVQRATPKWADRVAIRAVYAEAAKLTEATGIIHEVDHIVPLKGKRVCGLHVAHNLRPLPQAENRRKKNRLVQDLARAS